MKPPRYLATATGSLTESGWRGALRVASDDDKGMPPLIWTCEHRHRHSGRAQDCAAKEAARRVKHNKAARS